MRGAQVGSCHSSLPLYVGEYVCNRWKVLVIVVIVVAAGTVLDTIFFWRGVSCILLDTNTTAAIACARSRGMALYERGGCPGNTGDAVFALNKDEDLEACRGDYTPGHAVEHGQPR